MAYCHDQAVAGPQLTAAQDAQFPNDGYDWQVECLVRRIEKGEGRYYTRLLEEWVAIYQNFVDPARREIIYTGFSCQEVLDWIQPQQQRDTDEDD